MAQAIKKILLGATLIVGLGGYVQWSSTQNQTASAQTTDTSTPAATTVSDSVSGQTTPATAAHVVVATATPTPVQTGMYKNGTYTGSVASTDYGEIQVSAIISGGKLANVTFLTYTANQGQSIQIKNYSVPLLKTEAIASQSANVDIVSGATQTSQAFQESLGAALTQAQT